MNNFPPVLELINIERAHQLAGQDLKILDQLNLSLERGEMVAVLGPSGSGKTTLLNIAGLMEPPDKGMIKINEKQVNHTQKQLNFLRSRYLGFVHQRSGLIAEFSALENILLPQKLLGISPQEAEEQGRKLLKAVGLEDRADHRPQELSGGEQQRVAIARALANRPHILLADEPTGNLDPNTAIKVFDYLIDICHEQETAALIVTHNPKLAEKLDRQLVLDHGRLNLYS